MTLQQAFNISIFSIFKLINKDCYIETTNNRDWITNIKIFLNTKYIENKAHKKILQYQKY